MNEGSPTDGFDSDSDIAVVGMAGRFPGARNIDEYWTNLRDGVESLTVFSDEELLAAGVEPQLLRDPHYVKTGAVLPDMEMFDAAFFGFSPREASIMDPQHRHFLECSWEALENAGHTPERFSGPIGVFGGSGHNLSALMLQLRAPAPSAPAAGEPEGGAPQRTGWKAPATVTEQLIAQMWSELLGVAHISATDNFFELGSHSLLAVQVINKLKKRTGKALPLTALLSTTVETLAALIEPRDPSSDAAQTSTPGSSVSAPLDPALVRIRAGDGDGAGNGEIGIVDVSGGHSCMLQQPHVQVLAKHLQLRIDRALLNASRASPCAPADELA